MLVLHQLPLGIQGAVLVGIPPPGRFQGMFHWFIHGRREGEGKGKEALGE